MKERGEIRPPTPEELITMVEDFAICGIILSDCKDAGEGFLAPYREKREYLKGILNSYLTEDKQLR